MNDQTHHHDLGHAAHRWFGKTAEALDASEARVLRKTFAHEPLSQDTNETFDDTSTFGQRLSDRVAELGGSWGFIISFGAFLAVWAGINLALAKHAFDPYPFIFLNLLLSMVAALQAPIIMMSQNRQAAKDRLDASHDYEVNLKAEIEIMALHDKLDQLRTQDLEGLIRKQQEQIDMLTRLLEKDASR